MNQEVLLKYLPKNPPRLQKGVVNYFVTRNLYAFTDEVITFSPDNSVGQDFKSSFGLESRQIDRLVESALRKAGEFEMEIPNQKVLNLTNSVLKKIISQGFLIDFINPSVEGGIILELDRYGIYYLIEFFNDGDIVFLKRNGDNREVFDLDEEGLFEQIG